jgi:succinyl-diaminopimelate desuccinylase
MPSENLNTVFTKIESYKDQMIQMQGKLTEIPAIAPESGGKGEWEKAKLIKSYMMEIGFDKIEEYNCPDPRTAEGTRPNLVGIIYGKDRSKTIWVMSHIDVVPEGDRSKWNSDPFKIKVEGDKVFGRGTEDNQQAIVTSLYSIKALRDLNITPKYNIGVIIVSDEETGSKYGIDYVVKNATNIFTKKDLIIVPDAGDEKGEMIEVAEKGILWVKFTTKGKQTHGSTPGKGINAHRAAAALIMKLNNLYKDFGYKDKVFDPAISTFEPTKKENNIPNINTVPGEDIFYADCRILPKYSIDSVLKKMKSYCKEIEKKYKVKISMDIPQRADAAPATPVDAEVVLALKKAVKTVLKINGKPMGIGGGTVAAFFRKAGYHAVCWTRLDDTLHGPNEFCKISNLLGDAKVFAHVYMDA